jgi:hypothetical protein
MRQPALAELVDNHPQVFESKREFLPCLRLLKGVAALAQSRNRAYVGKRTRLSKRRHHSPPESFSQALVRQTKNPAQCAGFDWAESLQKLLRRKAI